MEIITFLIVFGILFIGELGDKTQLIVFNLTLEYEKYYKLGIGVTIGFALIVTIGVLFGVIITQFIPLTIISFISGIVFIIIGILEARSLKKLSIERKELKLTENSKTEKMKNDNIDYVALKSKYSKLKKNPYLAGFVFIFLMELGDKTQILTITLASRYPHPIEVWLGSFLALTCVAWIGVLFGAIIARKLPKFYLKLIATSIFILVGIFILISSIA